MLFLVPLWLRLPLWSRLPLLLHLLLPHLPLLRSCLPLHLALLHLPLLRTCLPLPHFALGLRSMRHHISIGRKRPACSSAGWAAMIDAFKLGPVGAGCVLILKLRPHGRRMLFM